MVYCRRFVSQLCRGDDSLDAPRAHSLNHEENPPTPKPFRSASVYARSTVPFASGSGSKIVTSTRRYHQSVSSFVFMRFLSASEGKKTMHGDLFLTRSLARSCFIPAGQVDERDRRQWQPGGVQWASALYLLGRHGSRADHR